MINKTNYSYFLFSRSSIQPLMFYCVHKSNNSILLTKPRLVYSLAVSIEKTSYSLQSNSIVLDSRLMDVSDNNSNKNNNNTSTKFEKKNKNSLLLNENVSSKKSKINNRKKKRNQLDLEQEDFFVDDSSLDTESNLLKSSIIQVIRSRKVKRKNKFKQGLSNPHSIYNHEASYDTQQQKNQQILLDSPLTIEQLANKINVSEASIITWLFLQGISVTINQLVDTSIATKVAEHYGFTVINAVKAPFNKSMTEKLISHTNNEYSYKRAPIITIFGHVDHGKTTLLDYIRKTNIALKEAGGITQSINGYEVNYSYKHSLEKLVFLDTPGHKAFTSMRLRSAEVTDIAILLVAADDGLKPQTIEAISYIQKHNLPCIIAINKIDKEDIRLDIIKNQLSQYDFPNIECDGQENLVAISALTGLNIDNLLSKICELSNSLNLRANFSFPAEGTIIESYLNKKIGPIATIVIKNGTLNIGDIIVSGINYGKIKSIINSQGAKIDTVSASSIVQVCGFSSLPQTGLNFCCVDNEKTAKYLVSQYMKGDNNNENIKFLNTRVTLKNQQSNAKIKTVNLILKGDTQGSIEAILYALSQISQDKVQINIVSFGLGSVFDKDINLAVTSQSIILAFNVSILDNIRKTAERLNIMLKDFTVIYNLTDYLKQYMMTLLAPEYDKVLLGEAIVQTVFNINKGVVAGCLVRSGSIKQGSYIVVYRKNVIVYEGLLTSLKQLKDSVVEVKESHECGIMCINYDLWQQEDRIEAFEMIQKQKML